MIKNAEDIISLPIEINDRMADSKFRLVHIASQRVRELSAGDQPLVTSRSIKDTTIALEESLLGAYTITTGEEAKVAKEEEIRKELSAYLSESPAEGEGAETEAAPEESEPEESAEEGESGGEAYSEE